MELIRQQDDFDCGVANCVMIINHYSKVKTTIEDFKLTHKYNREEYSLDDIKNLLINYQIEIDFYEIETVNKIIDVGSYPVLLVVKNNDGFNHYVIVNDYENGSFEMYDPNYKFKKKLTVKQLQKISLNIIGFINKTNKREETKLNFSFNKKYWLRFLSLFKQEWKTFIVINLITTFSLFSFFFGNMFIKVLLTEYSYLTFKRAILIVLMFIGIITLWLLMLCIQRWISRINNQRVIHKYLVLLDEKYDLSRANYSFNEKQQLEEINNLANVLNQQLYLLNNCFGFSLFTIAVIYLTAHISIVLLVGTLLLILCLAFLKIWHVKRNYINGQINNLQANKNNYFRNSLVNNFKGINQKISLNKYLELNKEYLKEPNLKDQTLVMYFEKSILFVYYLLMIFTMHNSGLDVSLFLVITNITFVFSNQLERILNAFNYSFLVNKKLKIINNLKLAAKLNKSLNKITLTNKKVSVTRNVIRTKNINDILINHYPVKYWEQLKQIFDCSIDLVLDEVVSNNLFNYGQSNSLDNFNKFKLNKWLEKLNINLSLKTHLLNEEQQEFIKLASCLFTNKRIILIRKTKYKWFLYFERDIKKYLKDKVVIIYE